MLQDGYPDPAPTSGDWGGVTLDPTVPPSDATTADAMPEGEYGDGSAPEGDWAPDEAGGIDPGYYADSSWSASGDGGAWDPYSGSSLEPYAPAEEEEAPAAVPEGEDPDAPGSF